MKVHDIFTGEVLVDTGDGEEELAMAAFSSWQARTRALADMEELAGLIGCNNPECVYYEAGSNKPCLCNDFDS